MNVMAKCSFCGEVTTIVAVTVYCGWYPCSSCKELAVYVHETGLTPREPSPWTIVDFVQLDMSAVAERSIRSDK